MVILIPISILAYNSSMGFCRQEYWTGLPFLSPWDHILLELLTMTHQSWLVLHSMSHIFIELHKPLCHDLIHEVDSYIIAV